MRRFARVAAAGALILAGATILTGAGALGSLGPDHKGAKRSFTLGGHVRGLYPGAHRKLSIVVHNLTGRPLHVRTIRTRVHDARRTCRARNERIARYRGTLRLQPPQWRRVSVGVRMLRSAPSSCQRAVFRLEFQGTATR